MATAYKRQNVLVVEPREISNSEESSKKLVLAKGLRHGPTCPFSLSQQNKCTCVLVDVSNGGGTLIPETHFTIITQENAISWDGFEERLQFPISRGDLFRILYQSR